MKLQDKVKKEQQKSRRPRQRREFMRRLVILFIGYPFVFPIEKLKNYSKKCKEAYWIKRLNRLREKALKETICYIEKDLARMESYVIYNAFVNDSIDYGNAFYLRNFYGRQFSHYLNKEHPVSYLYYQLTLRSLKESGGVFNEEQFYEGLFQEIESILGAKYQDLNMERKIDKVWSRNYEYLVLKVTE